MKPPRLSRWLLTRLLPPGDREFVLGDLEELAGRSGDRELRRRWRRELLAAGREAIRRRGTRRGRPQAGRARKGTMGGRLWRDIEFAIRSLLRRPRFAVVVVGTLALGIGSATAIFAVVDAVVFRPLDYPEPERLVMICEEHPSVRGYCVVSPPNAMDWRERVDAFEEIGLFRDWSFTLRSDAGARLLRGGIATPETFRILGFKPAAGRLFVDTDQRPSPDAVAVLSHELWQTAFGGTGQIVGETLVLGGEAVEVVGVLPPDAEVPGLAGVEIWRPLHFRPAEEARRGWRGFRAVARLRPGATLDGTRRELTTVYGRLAGAHPDTNQGWEVRVRPLGDVVVGDVRDAMFLFLAAVGGLLLIACANVANVTLTRALDRRREIAVRASLGAERRSLVRMLLTESGLLALAGGAGGLILAWALVGVGTSLLPADIPRIDEIALDLRVAGFALAASVATSLLIGLLPALRATRTDLVVSLKEGASGVGGRLLRRTFTVVQVGLTATLLVSAALLGRSFLDLVEYRPGFDRERLLTAWLTAFEAENGQFAVGSLERARDAVAALPGVEAAGLASAGPLWGGRELGRFVPAGTADPAGAEVAARWFDAGPEYFRALGIVPTAGRPFSEADRAETRPVAIVNETLARRLWPAGDPLGRRLVRVERGDTLEIVGVVPDLPSPEAEGDAEPKVWWPIRQRPRPAAYLVVRTSGPPYELVPAVRRAIADAAPEIALGSIADVAERMDRRMQQPLFRSVLVGGFGLAALLIAAVGVYGVVAVSVAQRRREIGIRKALGAETARVVREVVAEGVALAVVGVVVGLLIALALGRLLTHLLHGVGPTDPLSYALAAASLLFAASAASWAPGLRAARIEPREALRHE